MVALGTDAFADKGGKPPTNSAAPTISGTAQEGSTLTASTGTWAGPQITYTYKWRRCDANGLSCADIAGASSRTYVLTTGDVGSTMRVVVTATNSNGSASAGSAQTAVVQPAPARPVNTSPPSISGTAQQGQTVTASAGSWTGTPPLAYAYQWRRCDSGGSNCTDIAGATAQAYSVASADVGGTLRVAVTASNAGGSTTATSAATSTVLAPPATSPANTAAPTISGTAQQGQTLTADPGTWTGTSPISYTYQWRRCDSTGAGCIDIAAATAQTYTVSSGDVGGTLRVAVTGSNAGGSSIATSAATSAVTAPANAPANTTLPTISGTVQQGAQLVADPGTWTGTQPIQYAYQWLRCDGTGGACAEIGGATTNTYTVVPLDGGTTLRARVTASNAGGSATASSDQTSVVPAATGPSNTTPPSISGTTQTGQTLTANPGQWAGTQPITYAYQWRRCDPSYRDAVLSGGPVGYWRLDEASGSSAADLSGRGNTGTYGGSYALGQPGALTDDPDTAVAFLGSPVNGNMLVPHSSSLGYGDDVSYEAWVKLTSLPPSTSSGSNVITKNVGSMLMRIYPTGIVALRKSGGSELAHSGVALTPDGQYHQLVGTKSGATIHLYIDGVDVTTAVANQSLTVNTSQLVIGHNPVSTNDGLDGSIDEVAVFDHGLSAADVARHYNAGSHPGCTDVGGATGSTYVLTTADAGSALRVNVTATNASGSTTASSGPTGVVTNPAGPAGWTAYRDQPIGNAGIAPTGSKPESKLWWNDGSWWAPMWSSSANAFDIFRLSADHQTWADTGVAIDNRGGTRADVLWDGAHLYVASHVFSTCGCSTSGSGQPARLYRYSYDSGAKTYSLDSGFPVSINDTASETLVIDKDSTGTLWATWAQDNAVRIAHTVGGDTTWSASFTLPVSGATTLNTDDISSVVAFGGNQIGVMWSNQNDSAMYFSVHVDGAADTAWSVSRNAVPGPNYADDHISLRSLQADGSGRVFAAVKTSLGDLPNPNPNAPLIMLLVRDAGTGDWANYVFGRVGDDHTRSIVMLDEQNNVIHMFATAPVTGGGIYEKTSPLNAISFASGLGTRIMTDPNSQDMNNVTSTKQNVNSTTGLVVMASNDTTQPTTSYPNPTGGYYWHAYESLGP